MTFEDLSGVFRWYLILWPLIISGILASLKVGELAQLLVSGAGGASAGLGTRVRQVAMAAKSGGASLAAGGKMKKPTNKTPAGSLPIFGPKPCSPTGTCASSP